MDTPVIVALIGGWAAIIGGLIDLRQRTNGTGPLAKKLDELKGDVSDLKLDVYGVKQDVRGIKNDLQAHLIEGRDNESN